MVRVKISDDIAARVLLASGRRCALCFGINGDTSEKKGQLAHIDRNPSRSDFDNLAFLCMDHHDQYDSKTSQSRGLMESELRTYRDALYAFVEKGDLVPRALRAESNLAYLVPHPMVSGVCSWQLKESQVLLCERNPARAGYYPVLVGLEVLLRTPSEASAKARDELIAWTLSNRNFEQDTDWFKHSASSMDPEGPPMYDIRHTAEVGIALVLDGRSHERVKRILNNVVSKQGSGCAQGSWKSNDAAASEDPLSTVICTEFLARAADGGIPIADKGDLNLRIKEAMDYLDREKRPRGWRYEDLHETFWEPWGASIVGFRLRHWLPTLLKRHVVECLVGEIESTDRLLSTPSLQRVRLLTRYLCALAAVKATHPLMASWVSDAFRLWASLDASDQDISTKLHLAYLAPCRRPDAA